MAGAPWTKTVLVEIYVRQKKSAHEIATTYSCSDHKVNFWLAKYHIQKRSISEAVYAKSNPNGDPFLFTPPHTKEESFLFGLGVGLYWGEGNKKNKNAIRLGNTDPYLQKRFLEFLVRFYNIPKWKFRFGLQIFSDMSPTEALQFWSRTLGIPKKQFMKVIVTPARSIGTYREKTKHGVLTICVCNKKLRDLLCGEIEKLQ
ncbi:MAG: hypothetical protein Q7S26_01445 [bacterium]|nr:hypothetical protein [bacterium]